MNPSNSNHLEASHSHEYPPKIQGIGFRAKMHPKKFIEMVKNQNEMARL
jgi:hypothetical protein